MVNDFVRNSLIGQSVIWWELSVLGRHFRFSIFSRMNPTKYAYESYNHTRMNPTVMRRIHTPHLEKNPYCTVVGNYRVEVEVEVGSSVRLPYTFLQSYHYVLFSFGFGTGGEDKT